MAARLDAHTEDDATATTTNESFSHAGGADVKGVLVLVAQNTSVSDQLPDGQVTYGGVNVPRVRSYVATAGEEGRVYAFFLGSGVPDGTQTCAWTISGTAAGSGFSVPADLQIAGLVGYNKFNVSSTSIGVALDTVAVRDLAGGDVTVNPDTGTATLSGNAPTVAHVSSAAAGALTLTGLAPSLVFSVAPAAGTLTLTGLAPTVTITVAAGVGTATLSGFAPTIDAGGDVTVEPDTGTVTLSGFTPTVSISVAAGVGVLALSGLAPTVSVSALPTLATLTLTGLAPTVSLSASAGIGTLTFSGLAPSLLYSVSPETGALSLLGFDPEIPDFGVDLILSPVTKAPLFLAAGGSGGLEEEAGSQISLTLDSIDKDDLTSSPVTKGTLTLADSS